MVITEEGLVIIDTLVHAQGAEKVLEEFRKITDKPVKYVIYTHGHTDHVHGTPVFMEPETEVIATRQARDQLEKDLGWLRPYHRFCRGSQAGRLSQEYALKIPYKHQVSFDERELVLPTITFEEEYAFSLGGKRFELFRAPGETPCHLTVWIARGSYPFFRETLYYASFPNLSSPMLEARPVREWVKSLDRMVSLNARYMVPGHTAAVVGEDNVRHALTTRSKVIQHVFSKTVEAINQGKTVDEAVRTVKLPDEMAGPRTVRRRPMAG